jgi:SSS family solute:Na+ symporter/sodium/proline symporter
MLYVLTCVVYVSALLALALRRGGRARTGDEFVVAGRRLPGVVLVGTLLATWIGSGSILGGAGLAYRTGWGALWLSAGAWAAILVLHGIAGRARALAHTTVPELLEARYGPAARALGAVVTVIAYTAIVSYQYRAGGLVLERVTGLEPQTGQVLTAAVVVLFTVVAGMISVAYTDLANGVILTAGLLAALGWLVADAGGPGAILSQLPPEHLDPLGTLSPTQALGIALPPLFLLLGEANMYGRFFSAKSAGVARRAVAGWIAGTIVVEGAIVAIAVAGRARFPGLDAPGGEGAETVILRVLTDALPPALGALLLAAVLAIVVSTADSFLLAPATSLVRDVWARFVSPRSAGSLVVLRTVVVALGVLAWLQLRFFSGVLEAALYAYTMYGAGVTPAVLAAFLWRRATPAGGVASIAAGMTVTLLWEGLRRADALPPGAAALDTIFPALGASVLALLVVSLATPPPPESRWRPFFRPPEESP